MVFVCTACVYVCAYVRETKKKEKTDFLEASSGASVALRLLAINFFYSRRKRAHAADTR
jgi:hypothetical protein